MKQGTWRSHSRNEHAAGEEATDRVFSLMIRERDKDLLCIACGKEHSEYQAGHYRPRGCRPTRWHPYNVNAEGTGCNIGHTTKYGIKDMDLYRANVNKRWGRGMTEFLYKLSMKIEPFTTDELSQLRSAARMGYNAYFQFYKEIRPHHFKS